MALADWDARLLSPARALELAGDWPLYADVEVAKLSEFGDEPDQWQVNLRCNEDHQSVARLGFGRKYEDLHALGGCKTSIGDLLSAVVRHMVTAHDLSLSGASRG